MISRSELLEDYCQLCGSTVGSPECCKNKHKHDEPVDPHDDPSDDRHLEE